MSVQQHGQIIYYHNVFGFVNFCLNVLPFHPEHCIAQRSECGRFASISLLLCNHVSLLPCNPAILYPCHLGCLLLYVVALLPCCTVALMPFYLVIVTRLVTLLP